MSDYTFTGDESAVWRLNMLNLVDEWERAITQNGIVWTTQDMDGLPQKLADVLATLRRQADN
jgi:hypothetical protein